MLTHQGGILIGWRAEIPAGDRSDIMPMVEKQQDQLLVNEIFFSIQGESSFAGRPCAFLRLSSCNLRCSYCDTEYAFYEGQQMSLEEVAGKIDSYPTDLVEITGGEPLLQSAVRPLLKRFLDTGKTVLIETGGSLDIRPLDRRAVIIYDIKCPDSGMAERNLWENLDHLKPEDEVKFVVGSRSDYDWARQVIRDRKLGGRHTLLFSAVWGKLEPQALAEWILEDGLPARLQVQLHKILWGPETRGV